MPATDPPVRILHVAQATATGVAVYVTSLARHQIEQGMDARIACPPWGLLDEWVRRDGLPRFTWTADRQPGRALPQELRDLRAIIDEFDPDIVHLTSSKAGLAGRLVLRGRRPTVFSPEAWSFLLPGWTRRPSLMWERFATRWTTQVLVACEEEAAAGRAAGVHATYAVAEHGVDIEVFGYADDEARAAARATLGLDADAGPLVVCAGRLCYQKGQKPLLAAWRQVRAQVPGSRLLLVGDGEDEAELVAMAPDGVDFVGNRADMAPWYAAADLAVQPSRYEALSFSVLEALSVGRPVVAFDGIGMRTAIGPDAGALVPMDDVDGLASAIVERLEDPARCRREGQAGRERVVNRFRLDQLGANATRAVLQVLDRPSRPGPSAVPTGRTPRPSWSSARPAAGPPTSRVSWHRIHRSGSANPRSRTSWPWPARSRPSPGRATTRRSTGWPSPTKLDGDRSSPATPSSAIVARARCRRCTTPTSRSATSSGTAPTPR